VKFHLMLIIQRKIRLHHTMEWTTTLRSSMKNLLLIGLPPIMAMLVWRSVARHHIEWDQLIFLHSHSVFELRNESEHHRPPKFLQALHIKDRFWRSRAANRKNRHERREKEQARKRSYRSTSLSVLSQSESANPRSLADWH